MSLDRTKEKIRGVIWCIRQLFVRFIHNDCRPIMQLCTSYEDLSNSRKERKQYLQVKGRVCNV